MIVEFNLPTLPQAMEITKISNILDAMTEIYESSKLAGFNEKERLLIKLAVEEACTNAYEYCSWSQSKEPIIFRWEISRGVLRIGIQHQGELFSIKENHALNTGLRGRGLQLIIQIMDDVKVEKIGSDVCLFMEKKAQYMEAETIGTFEKRKY